MPDAGVSKAAGSAVAVRARKYAAQCYAAVVDLQAGMFLEMSAVVRQCAFSGAQRNYLFAAQIMQRNAGTREGAVQHSRRRCGLRQLACGDMQEGYHRLACSAVYMILDPTHAPCASHMPPDVCVSHVMSSYA